MNSFRRSIAIISSLSQTLIRNVLILVISLHRVHHTDVGVVYGDHHVSRIHILLIKVQLG